MPLPGLIFSSDPQIRTGLTSRADVAVFVGLVPRRAQNPVPDTLRAWLVQAGWALSPNSHPATARPDKQVQTLLDVPVPIDDWNTFDALFAWERRLVQDGGTATMPCALGAAVRAFFAEGGRRCYVVRCGNPPPLLGIAPTARALLLSWAGGAAPADAAGRRPILPGFAARGIPASAADPTTWHGAAHVLGIDEAAMLLLPDLADVFAGDPTPLPPPPAPPPVPELFVTCAPAIAGAGLTGQLPPPPVSAARLDPAGYAGWSAALRFALDLMDAPGAAARRDVMLLTGLPLPASDARAEAWPLATLGGLNLLPAIGSARLQLGYPWIATDLSATLPEGVQSPEGALAGLVARRTLLAGAHASAAGTLFAGVTRTLPELARADVVRGLDGGEADWLGDRISLVMPRSDGMVLVSDATMADDAGWRAAGVSRLMGTILRAARGLGQELMFESSGEALWGRARQALQSYLTTLWASGALDGASAAQAFDVRCDRSTMTQSDLDAGRLIATVAFTASQPVQRITVTLALAGDTGGGSSLAAAA